MLIKGSASRFYRRIREDLPAKIGWPCLSGAVSRKVPPAENAPFVLPSDTLFSAASPARFPHSAYCFRNKKDALRPSDRPCCRKFAEHRRAACKERRQHPNAKAAHHYPRAFVIRLTSSPQARLAGATCPSSAPQFPPGKTAQAMPVFLHAGGCRLCRQRNPRSAKRAARATRLAHAQKMHKKRAANLSLQLSIS